MKSSLTDVWIHISQALKLDLTIDIPKAGPSPPSLQLASGMATSRVRAPTPPIMRQENIQQGESWSVSFERAKAAIPSEVIPGLYLGNMKTAAAYILGKVDDDYPPVSRIVTILTASNAYPRLPNAQGSGKRIERKGHRETRHDRNKAH